MKYARLTCDHEGWRGYVDGRWIRLSEEEGEAEFAHYTRAGSSRLMSYAVLAMLILATAAR
jgi:hypothetical protein